MEREQKEALGMMDAHDGASLVRQVQRKAEARHAELKKSWLLSVHKYAPENINARGSWNLQAAIGMDGFVL